jgi:hypothetical protein
MGSVLICFFVPFAFSFAPLRETYFSTQSRKGLSKGAKNPISCRSFFSDFAIDEKD